MIKKFIDKLLGKEAPSLANGKRREYSAAELGIDPSLVDERAVRVVETLQEEGYEAYIVGGAVRDLLMGLRPKDFDVATNATPEQVKGLFRRAFIIGKRFRIVHVVYGRGREHEVIEVSTFRAYLDPSAAEQVQGNERTAKHALAGKSHVVDASGRVLRDNVWGPQHEDAARRDFTVNAMYYDPSNQMVVDYHGGVQDAKKKTLRIIGDPMTRYREDPVRIIRAVRFAAKLGFDIETKTRTPMKKAAALLAEVPQSRLFDEMMKLLQTGHALASLEELAKQGLGRGVFPLLDVVLDDAHRHDGREKFIQLALADTDRRVDEGKPVAPSFMLACMLWHDVQSVWQKAQDAGEAAFPALQYAVDSVFDARVGDISGRGKLGADMREIWMMQPRFDKRSGNGPFTMVEQPRFRAGFDFLRLRAQAGEIDAELAQWWESFSQADVDGRRDLLAAVRLKSAAPAKRVRKAKKADTPASGEAAPLDGEPPFDPRFRTDIPAPEGEGEAQGDAPAKRRRRRRKPAGARGDAGGPGGEA